MPFPSLPTGRRRRLMILAGIVVVLGGLLVLLTTALDRQREAEELQALVDTIAALRSASDGCRGELARAEAEFRHFQSDVDSLRARISRYEELDPEGVPADEYDAYLETFDRYNASAREWESRADSLRAYEGGCRALVERHNLLTDSLRDRVEALEQEAGG